MNVMNVMGETKLFKAAKAGDVNQVARLLADKANPELADNEGFVRCFVLSFRGWQARCVQLTVLFEILHFLCILLMLQTDAASHCLVEGKEKVVRVLIDAHVNVEAVTNNGCDNVCKRVNKCLIFIFCFVWVRFVQRHTVDIGGVERP
jgi:hypothetical protein